MPSVNRLTLVRAWFDPDYLLRIEYRHRPDGLLCCTSFLRSVAFEYANPVAELACGYWRYDDACKAEGVEPSADGFNQVQAVRDRLRRLDPPTDVETALGTITQAFAGLSAAVIGSVVVVDYASAQIQQLVDEMAKIEDAAFLRGANGSL